ncbi:MAG TPA: NYN domain-containing protein, partial [Spirochaetota bacterium]|nr:NYN domain-containing protein [Spirochaetota bacterium]
MVLLIDGFNLIYKFPDLEEKMLRGELNDARAGLLDRLKEFQKIRKSQIRVVFDGKKNPSHNIRSEKVGRIDVYYSLDYSADFLIKEFIKKDPNPKMSTVVTSDKDILFYVNRFKAKTMTSEKFADFVTKTIEEHYT